MGQGKSRTDVSLSRGPISKIQQDLVAAFFPVVDIARQSLAKLDHVAFLGQGYRKLIQKGVRRVPPKVKSFSGVSKSRAVSSC